MAKFSKLALFFVLVLCLNVTLSSARARPSPDDDEDDWNMFPSEEEDEEHSDDDDHHDHHDHQAQPGETSRSLGASPGGGGQQLHSQGSLEPIQHKHHNDEDQAKSGFFGGNVAGFNESCGGPSNKICNSERHIVCSASKFCDCEPQHIYIRSQETCFPIAKDSGSCRFDDQCHNGKWGRLSRCEETTALCQCFDKATNGKNEVAYIDETCVLKKSINQGCEMDRECQATMGDNAVCAPAAAGALPGWLNSTETCQCRKGHTWHVLENECYKIADTGLSFECKDDIQCTASSLGSLSKCSWETKKCECHDPARPGPENVVFYKPRGTCFAKKSWNDTCNDHDECKASISSEAECFVNYGTSDISVRSTCQCPEGKICPLDANGAIALGSSLITVVLVATMVVLGNRRV